MKARRLLFLSFLLLSWDFAGVKAQAFETQAIVWSSRRLSWDDFRQGGGFKGKGVSASTRWMLLVQVPADGFDSAANTQVIYVKALFVPALSWVDPDQPKSSYLLAHEQLHFDIAELLARALRKELGESSYTREQLLKAAQKLERDCRSRIRKMQRTYDDQSEHSRNEKAQASWTEDVAKGLDALKDYASFEMTIRLK